jgi:hypothetical protein
MRNHKLHTILKDTAIFTFITKEEFNTIKWFCNGETSEAGYITKDGVKYYIDQESDMDADYDYNTIYRVYQVI